ncbi:SURF1 family protein [Microbacterium sp. 18062]|uniref:SURF1 family cytochrome oxidase biogenesis protein n=1 Tax=Microbacterium sp. 18062 TaxID=2681410 RepID=UPI00135B4A25|nr:SURF1 family protein [Microbacterium sp. 18062]
MNLKTASPAVRWTVYVLVAVAFAIACVFLSQWQFSRNDARTAQLELVERNFDAAPIALDEVVDPTGGFDPALEWHPVVVTGAYLTDAQLVVRNRPHGGTSAFEVLVPFRADDGRILVVDRGWIPPAESGEGTAAIPAPPDGEVTIVVRLRPSEALPTSGRSAPAGQVPTIHLPLIAETTGAETITDAYGVLASEDPAAAETPFPLDAPSEDPGPHLSYAIQWILFAIMGFVFIGYIIRTELRYRREDAEEHEGSAEQGPPSAGVAPSPAPPAGPVRRRPLFERRPDRDMADEDALLDHAER